VTSPSQASQLELELTEGEYIAPRGKREVTWLVRLNDGWIHISAWPGVAIERCQAKSGTVWENRTLLRASPGTRLIRVVAQPAAYERRDALDYLSRGSGNAKRVVRQEFVVGRRGELLRKREPGVGPTG
jgi:hypothetical protein